MDPRVARTRSAIANALRTLLSQRSIDDISVADIIASARVSRSSFYQHFASKEDLLCHVMHPLVRELAEAATNSAACAELRDTANSCWRDRHALKVVLASSARAALRRAIAAEIVRNYRGLEQHDFRLRIVATSVAEAELAIVEQWLSGSESFSEAQLALLVRQVARGAFESIEGRFAQSDTPLRDKAVDFRTARRASYR